MTVIPTVELEDPDSPNASRKSSLKIVQAERPSLTGAFLDLPNPSLVSDDSNGGSSLSSRRCSTRVLSLNVQQTLRHLRQQEHKSRVEARIEKNAEHYEKQRFCECVTMLSLLSIFTSFSLYVVFAHGFHFGEENPFNIRGRHRTIIKEEVSFENKSFRTWSSASVNFITMWIIRFEWLHI